jgi:hypothetical protein
MDLFLRDLVDAKLFLRYQFRRLCFQWFSSVCWLQLRFVKLEDGYSGLIEDWNSYLAFMSLVYCRFILQLGVSHFFQLLWVLSLHRVASRPLGLKELKG